MKADDHQMRVKSLKWRNLPAVIPACTYRPTEYVRALREEGSKWWLHVSVPERFMRAPTAPSPTNQPRERHSNKWKIKPHKHFCVLNKNRAGGAVLPFSRPRIARHKVVNVPDEFRTRRPLGTVKQRVDLGVLPSRYCGDPAGQRGLSRPTDAGHENPLGFRRERIRIVQHRPSVTAKDLHQSDVAGSRKCLLQLVGGYDTARAGYVNLRWP